MPQYSIVDYGQNALANSREGMQLMMQLAQLTEQKKLRDVQIQEELMHMKESQRILDEQQMLRDTLKQNASASPIPVDQTEMARVGSTAQLPDINMSQVMSGTSPDLTKPTASATKDPFEVMVNFYKDKDPMKMLELVGKQASLLSGRGNEEGAIKIINKYYPELRAVYNPEAGTFNVSQGGKGVIYDKKTGKIMSEISGEPKEITETLVKGESLSKYIDKYGLEEGTKRYNQDSRRLDQSKRDIEIWSEAFEQENGRKPNSKEIESFRKSTGGTSEPGYYIPTVGPTGELTGAWNPKSDKFKNAPGDQRKTPLPAALLMQGMSYKKSQPIIDKIDKLSLNINKNEGLYAKASGGIAKQAAKLNLDNDVAEYMSLVEGFVPLIARAVGHTGVLTELDVIKTMKLFPQPGDSKDLRDRKMKNINDIMKSVSDITNEYLGSSGGNKNDDPLGIR